MGSAGATNTAALAFGGNTSPPPVTAITESWNGTNWTEIADLNTARNSFGGNGTLTSALAYGGGTAPPFTRLAITESWNGSSWSEVNDIPVAGSSGGSAGADNTNALSFGQTQPNNNPATFEWTAGPATLTFTDS